VGATSQTIFTVTNTLDHGEGSLRAAIELANRAGAAARIEFAIGDGPVTLRLGSPLPKIEFSGLVDGWTQPGFSGAPVVEITGADAGAGSGLEIVGSDITVRGLAITGWAEDGIFVHDCADVTLVGLHLGIDQGGTTAAGNTGNGIRAVQADRCAIGGPGDLTVVSSGNGGFGMWFQSCSHARVEGSVIGTDTHGRIALPNKNGGIRVDHSGHAVLGGADEGQRNLISGNGEYGVLIAGPGSVGTTIIGNRIGTDVDGLTAVPNQLSGILVWDTPEVRVGGPAAGEGNLVSGNLHYGVLFGGEQARRPVVMGNRIGTDVTGGAALPNGHSGVVFQSTPEPRVGGAAEGEGNLISGNLRYGIEITRPLSAGGLVLGNYIGVDVSGQRAIANGRSGILVYNTPNVRIGGTDPGEGNVISGGARAGINIDGSAIVDTDFAGKGHCTGNVVRGNLIGTDSTGERPIGNELRGVLIYEAQDNLIIDNVISANTQDGILILGPEDDSDPNLVPSGNRVVRNRIGVTASGTPCGNGRHGVFVRHGKNNYVGGDTADDANVIASNAARGVMFSGVGATSNQLGESNDIRDNTLGPYLARDQK